MINSSNSVIQNIQKPTYNTNHLQFLVHSYTISQKQLVLLIHQIVSHIVVTNVGAFYCFQVST